MKPWIFDILQELMLRRRPLPERIAEIGTHKAKTAEQLVHFLAPRVDRLTYTGYDVFDFAVNNQEFNLSEKNGKGGALRAEAEARLSELASYYDNFTWELHEGFTHKTLTEPKAFDFVYIDGGHSYETVGHDYSMVKQSQLIVFDDYDIPGVYKFLEELKISEPTMETIAKDHRHLWAVLDRR